MIKRTLPLLLLGAALMVGAPMRAGEENEVAELVRTGRILPFVQLRNRIVTQVQGDYMGAEFDITTLVYRFRFLVDGNVINIDVDGRTGQRVRRTSSY